MFLHLLINQIMTGSSAKALAKKDSADGRPDLAALYKEERGFRV